MFALGLQGSPRKKGNSETLLTMFMAALARYGLETRTLDVCRMNVQPCAELTVCERKGICPIDDDMPTKIYPLLRQADFVVMASPVFFYNVTAQLKALIDRCQMFWARKYSLKLKDPVAATRRAFLLSVGASGGKQLFDGVHLTAKYFFDAIDTRYAGHLTYRNVEARGAIKQQPGLEDDVARAAALLTDGLRQRRKVLIVGATGACRSRMAWAYMALNGGRTREVICAALDPAAQIAPAVAVVMAEQGIDMAYREPLSIDSAMGVATPDEIICIGPVELPARWAGVPRRTWDLPPAPGSAMEEMRVMRDVIAERVNAYLATQPTHTEE